MRRASKLGVERGRTRGERRWSQVEQCVVTADAGRLPRSYAHGRDRPPPGTYNKEVIARAIIACYEALDGLWPTEWEFFDWAALQRAAARQAGKPLPLYPIRKRLF